MGDMLDGVRATIERRAVLVGEIAEIDREIAGLRDLLGLSALPEKTCPVCQQPFIAASPRQQMCTSCREASAHEPVTTIAARANPSDTAIDAHRTCERCGTSFVPKPGTAGRFCTRACFCAPSARRALNPAPAGPDPSTTDAAAVEARDAAVLRRIHENDGVAITQELRRWFLAHPLINGGGSDDAKAEHLKNSLLRLRAKGHIGRTGDTWSTVGAGAARG